MTSRPRRVCRRAGCKKAKIRIQRRRNARDQRRQPWHQAPRPAFGGRARQGCLLGSLSARGARLSCSHAPHLHRRRLARDADLCPRGARGRTGPGLRPGDRRGRQRLRRAPAATAERVRLGGHRHQHARHQRARAHPLRAPVEPPGRGRPARHLHPVVRARSGAQPGARRRRVPAQALHARPARGRRGQVPRPRGAGRCRRRPGTVGHRLGSGSPDGKLPAEGARPPGLPGEVPV